MKKSQIKTLAEYFGNSVPAGRIQNRDTRLAVVMLYGSLAKANMETMDEIEQVRLALVAGHEEEIEKYGRLAANPDTKAEADAMTECVRIDTDFKEAADKILAEEVKVDIKKIPLELLFDALADCGFPGLPENPTIAGVQGAFRDVIA